MAMMATRERRRLCKFIPGWMSTEEFSTWLCPVKGDKHKAYCRLCKKVFAVSHGGLNDVKTHYKGKKHIFLQQQETERSSKQFHTGLWEGSPLKLNTLIFNVETNELEHTNFSLSSYYEESLEDTSFGSEISKPRSIDSETELEASHLEMNSHQKLFPQQYCLRWKYHTNNMQVMFSQWLERESFCDVTLACEGRTIRAHKVVLSACSTYFDAIFSQYEENNPIVILKDVKFTDIKALVEFMYRGEINVDHSHLASLLKTAEDLRIKGLAEVSWRADNQESPSKPDPPVTNDDSDTEPPPPKKIREHATPNNFTPKVMNVTGNVGSEDAFTEGISENDVSGWDDSEPEVLPSEYEPRVPISIKQENEICNYSETQERNFNINTEGSTTNTTTTTPNSDAVSQRLAAQYSDVVKLNDYLTTGRRQQFWEEPFTRRIMEAIKSKELEMKAGAELLGVSYGTLYGRYRDAYGCLKHPYRMRDFWSESGPADVLAKVQRKEMTLFRAAEMLNVTVTTLANYLSTLRQSGSGSGGGASSGEDNVGEDSHDSLVADGPPPPQSQQSQSASPGQTPSSQPTPPMPPLTPAPTAAAAAAASATAVKLAALANNPDISIVKHEVTPRPETDKSSQDEDLAEDDILDEDDEDDDDEGSEDSLVVSNTNTNANGSIDPKTDN